MRTSIVTIAAAVAMGLPAMGAQAFPATPAPGMTAASDIVLAAGGCGRYRHPGRYGGCVRNHAHYDDGHAYGGWQGPWPYGYGIHVYGPGFYGLGPHCVIDSTVLFGSFRFCH